jgi:hypothetical protein
MPARKSPQNGKGVKDVMNFIKKNHLVSSGLGLIPHPFGQAGSIVARQLGLGKKPRARRPPQVGRGLITDLGGGLGNLIGGIGGGIGRLFGGAKRKRRNVVKV